MKFSLVCLALVSAVSAAPSPAPIEELNKIQKRCTAGTELYYWCTNACGYNCRAQYNHCRNDYGPNGCAEAYGRMLGYCKSCCQYGDCVSCQNCGNSYPYPPPPA